ncbi:hypothetical protein HMPREF9123_0320 [Neisseria bacilliformis ATCC BAA-1200]|uniref:Uncharacterized protein n=1 Tax=Neisseria bacilliformis ATCC BAA-1200 TaxID=888742 RepID=F2B9B7_9NEIS|nr:hypothetical protein HMPREF9123_0320 [Neisseria bacilliformis ATCC BAA-1200]
MAAPHTLPNVRGRLKNLFYWFSDGLSAVLPTGRISRRSARPRRRGR